MKGKVVYITQRPKELCSVKQRPKQHCIRIILKVLDYIVED